MTKIAKIDKIFRSQRRTISIEITDGAELIVRAPHFVDDSEIMGFVNQKQHWINKKIIEAKAKSPTELQFTENEKIQYLGKEYPLRLHHSKKYAIYFENSSFYLSEDCIDHAKEYLTMWYKNVAEKLFPARAEIYSKRMGIVFATIKISNAGKRWGSCSIKRNINLNWRLIMAPLEVIDYVIVHELAHVRQMNHSDKFWRIVRDEMPDYSRRRKWLKDNGHLLNL